MTKEKLLSICAKHSKGLEGTLRKYGYDPHPFCRSSETLDASFTRLCPSSIDTDDIEVVASHLLWMLRAIPTFSDESKAQRWLGFVQGVLASHFDATVDDLRDLVRDEAT